MPIELWKGLLIPFAGTALGAACVFFMRNRSALHPAVAMCPELGGNRLFI